MRPAWIIWSIAWAIFWFTLGWFLLPFINLLFGVASIALAFVPVGQDRVTINNNLGQASQPQPLPPSMPTWQPPQGQWSQQPSSLPPPPPRKPPSDV
jgi:hypothetical protein